eukprot:TRINITY_DN2119_c0_g1_i1.p1 TRINITY_DN2119_c0_g1~~TRINITY_DN2119_c0_g1_i1.p1  ORF type:complete len:386 (+),score=84.16 TRINITY_DN2119_c0_g1_i1:77-1234(+)
MIRFCALAAVLATALGRSQRLPESSRLNFEIHGRGYDECPCEDKSLCNAVTKIHEKEVFGFVSERKNTSNWKYLDMKQVTTVAWYHDPDMLCTSHANDIRLVAGAPNVNLTLLGNNETAMNEYVSNVVVMVKGLFLDGVTFDHEDPMPPGSPQAATYVKVVDLTTKALHKEVPGSQVSVCVAWSPFGIDGRWYDNKGLADASDLLYMMVYDTRSQVFEQCIAAPNAALPLAERGIQDYLSLGISPRKLILGLPWYGYDYPCVPGTAADAVTCFIPFVPFRGVNCSDAAGREIGFQFVMNTIKNATTGRRFSPDLSTANFNYNVNGTVHQLWYDDAVSLKPKYELCNKYNLRGTGPFTYADLDYSTPEAREQAQTMWDALKVFTGK